MHFSSVTTGLLFAAAVAVSSSALARASRALRLLPGFRTYRCVALAGDQSAHTPRSAADGDQLWLASKAASLGTSGRSLRAKMWACGSSNVMNRSGYCAHIVVEAAGDVHPVIAG